MPDRQRRSASPTPRVGVQTDEKEAQRTRLAFLGLNAEDRTRLRELAPDFAEFEQEFVSRFYEHLFAFEQTARLLSDEVLVKRLKELQREHFRSLLTGDWDEAYFERRRQVGHKHADVGVEPQFVLGAYSQYLQHCIRCYAKARDISLDRDLGWLLSLIKVVMLDAGLTLDAYFAQDTKRLQTALNMLWKANTDLRQFAQMTTHDLKTPLATVANLCEEAVDEFGDQMPAEARGLIDAARVRAFGMGHMIDELLSTTVAQSPDDFAKVDTQGVFHEALDRLRPAIADRGIELVLPDQWPEVRGDRIRLREAVYNILSNAVKFMDKAAGRIEIQTEVEHGLARFAIIDNGPGIPASELDGVFVPFRRLPQHRERPGSGLGLYFAKNLIEDQRGRIWVESRLGHGSRFVIELPTPRHDDRPHSPSE